jgi:hypothetical protein
LTLLLDPAAPTLFFDAFALRRGAGFRLAPRFGLLSGLSHQSDQALARISAVLLLGAEPAGIDDKGSLPGNPAAADAQQPPANILGQGSGIDDVESQLDRSRHAIDILAAWSGGPDEFFLDFVLIQRNVFIHLNHSQRIAVVLPQSGPRQSYGGQIEELLFAK